MREILTKDDIRDYSNSMKIEKDEYLKKSANIIKQYLLVKNNIIETMKETFLFPYLLEMEYLVGIQEGINLSDSPTETLGYFNIRNGVKELLNIEVDESTINNWNVFRLKIPIKNKFDIINNFTVYCFIRIFNNKVNYFLFSVYMEKIFNQETSLTMLDKQPNIVKIKGLINDGKL